MLNWEQIAQRVQNPQICSWEDVQDLKLLCDKYPYSQIFPMLYLKVLAKSKHILFEEELEKYAFKINDRAQLYDLIHADSSSEINVEEFQSENLSTNIEEKIIEETSVIQEIDDFEIENRIDENEGISDEIIIDTENLDTERQIISEEKQNIYPIEEELMESSDESELEQDIISSSLSSGYQLEESEEIEDEVTEFDLTKVDVELTLTTPIEKVKPPKQIDCNEPRTFNDWLKFSTTNSSFDSSNDQIDEQDQSLEITYIEFEKPKREFFSPIKKAKESLDESNLPVSETLAKIFEIQGNIPKSIFVYEQLCLIIPEKKTYFATQIKKLKKKLNQ